MSGGVGHVLRWLKHKYVYDVGDGVLTPREGEGDGEDGEEAVEEEEASHGGSYALFEVVELTFKSRDLFLCQKPEERPRYIIRGLSCCA